MHTPNTDNNLEVKNTQLDRFTLPRREGAHAASRMALIRMRQNTYMVENRGGHTNWILDVMKNSRPNAYVTTSRSDTAQTNRITARVERKDDQV